MRDIHEILRQKVADVDRVRQEIKALQLVISLLKEPSDEAERNLSDVAERKQPVPEAEPAPTAEQTGTEGPSFSSLEKPGFWKRRR